mmetsp:Transcript_110444/g.356489  ORF Transcript_110444/g.356489 Transcript_110444/m.356489 type:complete len:222 (-) Transcript_110444:536-1201(-)
MTRDAILQGALSAPRQLTQSCQSAAALSMDSRMGSSGDSTVRSAECRETRLSAARCNAATSRWPGPPYRMHQSTGAFGKAIMYTRYAPSLSGQPSGSVSTPPTAPPPPPAAMQVASSQTFLQRRTSATETMCPSSARISSTSLMACRESSDWRCGGRPPTRSRTTLNVLATELAACPLLPSQLAGCGMPPLASKPSRPWVPWATSLAESTTVTAGQGSARQ